MNSTTDARSALRDLFQFHLGRNAWLPLLLAAVAVGALVVLLQQILSFFWNVYPPVPSAFRTGIAYRAVICWVVSTLCTYAAGFIMGRLYTPPTA